jgi:peptide/nickel transport system substrate-binding protein
MVLTAALLAAACAAPQSPQTGGIGSEEAPRQSGPKRIVAAMTGDPHTLYNKINTNNAVRGIDTLEKLVIAGVAVEDDQGLFQPQLAEAVPSLSNGLWTVFPDGSMEMTWRLRAGTRWHDGTPFTTDDLLFAAQLGQDRELPAFGHIAFSSIDSIDALDAQTIRVRWKQPYIEADRMFAMGTSAFVQPLPRHLLESAYLENKAGFTDLPYWTTSFVSTGPFKLKDWVSGSHLTLEAFEDYALGRPRLDQIEVRFILDSNTLVANVLANEVDLTLGRGISIEQALQVRDAWRGGKVDTGSLRSAINLWPQLLNPTPAVLTDVRFRRAMTHAIDRQALVDTLQGGLTAVVHSWLRPTEPEFKELESNITRYDYDPRVAAQMLEGMGYTRGPDSVLRDAEGQRLTLEFRTITADINQKTLLAITDYWQRIGVAVDPVVVPTQRQSDLPYRATFPAYDLLRGNTSIENFNNLHSSGSRLPENQFRGGSGGTNYPRYMNPQFDALIDRFYATISRPERMRVAGQIVQHMTEQVLVTGIFYDLSPAFVSNRLKGLSPMGGDQSLPWNAHLWDV